MTDISSITARYFDSIIPDDQSGGNNQSTGNDSVSQLQQIREQRQARRNEGGESAPQEQVQTTNPRLTRRERLMRQTTQPNRSSERLSYSTYIQRTPVRSSSFDVSSTGGVDDARSYRDRFEATRQNIFGPRRTGSNENLTTSPRLGRRQSDTLPLGSRAVTQSGSDSGSGSSTPRTMRRNTQDLVSSLSDAFSRSFDTYELPETPRPTVLASRETRNSPTSFLRQNVSSVTNGSSLIRSSTRRDRDSRFRRRTIQGVDSNVKEALEIERRATDDYVVPSRLQESTLVEGNEDPLSSSTNSYFNSPRPSYSRQVTITKNETIPILGVDEETVIFVDKHGHVHWIKENRQLIRALKAKQKIPEIVVQNGEKGNTEADDGLISSFIGDHTDRYTKLNEHIKTLKTRDTNCDGDTGDGMLTPEIIDEKYQSVSLYTKPRPRPNIEKLVTAKEVASLYDGIDMDKLNPPEEAPPEVNIMDQLRNQQLTYKLTFAPQIRAQNPAMMEMRQRRIAERERAERASNISNTAPERRPSFHEVDNTDIHQNVNLVMERLNGLGMTIDTSHLDYEEMRMIQMALEENPSPPETPLGEDNPDGFFESSPHHDMSESVQLQQVIQNSMTEHVNETVTSEPHTETVEHQQVTESAVTEPQVVVQQRVQEEAIQETVHEAIAETVHEAIEDPVQEEPIESAVINKQTDTIEIELPHESSQSNESKGVEINCDSASVEPERKPQASPPTSLPSERLPSESPLSPKLPLPSMDFSPLEKKSKTQLDFSESSTTAKSRGSSGNDISEWENDSSSARHSTSSIVIETEEEFVFTEETISPIRKNSPDPLDRVSSILERRNGENYREDLSVEIPSNSETVSSTSTNELLTPAKSRNTSANTSGAVSPADSDSVTTTFEEFVAVIPREVLMQLDRKNSSS